MEARAEEGLSVEENRVIIQEDPKSSRVVDEGNEKKVNENPHNKHH